MNIIPMGEEYVREYEEVNGRRPKFMPTHIETKIERRGEISVLVRRVMWVTYDYDAKVPEMPDRYSMKVAKNEA